MNGLGRSLTVDGLTVLLSQKTIDKAFNSFFCPPVVWSSRLLVSFHQLQQHTVESSVISRCLGKLRRNNSRSSASSRTSRFGQGAFLATGECGSDFPGAGAADMMSAPYQTSLLSSTMGDGCCSNPNYATTTTTTENTDGLPDLLLATAATD